MTGSDWLEARIAALEHRLAAHENMRGAAFDALNAVQSRMGRIQQRLAYADPPELAATREEGLMPTLALIKTEQRRQREWLDELSRVVIDDHEILREIVTLLEREGE